MIERLHKHRNSLLCILLAVATLAVYWPVHNHEFIHYDDGTYITENPEVFTGLSLQNTKWAFTTGYASNWHPFTWLSHQLDSSLFAENAGAHHLVNVLFHIANTILLFVVLNRITRRFWPSAFVAALFALHPLHVESVAWAAERKDVLSTLFWLLTMLAYARYAERPSAVRYVVTLLFFVLGLLSKPMLITLPFVLLLLDYWPLLRFATKGEPFNQIRNPKSAIRNIIIEKIPFLLLSVASSIITYIVQQKGGAMSVVQLKDRIANAIISYLTYIGKMFWPARLAVIYPYPASSDLAAKAVIYAIMLILITVLLLYYGRRHKYLLVGWLWYLGTLVPVIGIIQVGVQAMADRYTYVPLIGLFVIIAFGAADLSQKIRLRKNALAAVAGVILIACTITTSIQLKYWKSSLLLFEHTLAVTKNNYTIYNNYANILNDLGRRTEAVQYLTESLRILPNTPDIHSNLGKTFMDLGRTNEAIEQYQKAIQIDPKFAMAHYNLGIALAAKGDYDAAIEQHKIYMGLEANLLQNENTPNAAGRFKKISAGKPDSAEIFRNLGYALARSGKPAEAIEYYNKSLRGDPDNIQTHGRLALALASLGRIDEALAQCRIVLKARPDDVEMHNNSGILLQAKGEIDEAIESYKKALQIDPNFIKARDNLDAITQKQPGK
jgi:protein O-mannosyl-transferase